MSRYYDVTFRKANGKDAGAELTFRTSANTQRSAERHARAWKLRTKKRNPRDWYTVSIVFVRLP